MKTQNDISGEEKRQVVLDLLADKTSVHEIEVNYGIAAADVESWKQLYVAGLREGAETSMPALGKQRPRSSKRTYIRAAGLTLGVLLVLLTTAKVWSQVTGECPNDLPHCFEAGDPAITSEVNQNFAQLQEELSSTENKFAFSRQHYNSSVRQYNTRLESFPDNIVGGMFGFGPLEFFEIEIDAERETPQVKF